MVRFPNAMIRLTLAVATVAATLVTVPSADVDATTVSPERIASDDPYTIAAEVARHIAGGDLSQLTDLIVTTGEQASDAVMSTGLSGYLDRCPRLDGAACRRSATVLTRPDAVPTVTAQVIAASRVPASRITVLGGEAAVSETVRTLIATLAGWNGEGTNPVIRVGGATRYETAAALVEHLGVLAARPGEVPLPASYRTVVIANGESASDALAASMLAYRSGHALLLSPRSSLDSALAAGLRTLGARCAVLVGGTAALDEAVEAGVADALAQTGSGACTPERIAGDDRVHTAALVASRGVAQFGGPSSVWIANARADSMPWTAAPLARLTTGLLFTERDTLPSATRTWMSQHLSIGRVTLVGTQAVMSSAIASETSMALPLVPAGGGGAGGGGGAAALGLAYGSSAFDTTQSSQILAPTVTGGTGPYGFAVTAGTLPTGVTFDATTGAFTGPAAWSLGTVVSVSAGFSHSCALLDDTTARCWGSNGAGQLGDGTSTSRLNPVTVTSGAGTPLGGVTQISTGGGHTCAVISDGTARCWGLNDYGQLGDGDATNDKSTPVPVVVGPGGPSLSGVTQISVGERHTCAVLVDTTVRCWGWRGDGASGREGRLGDGVQSGDQHYPVKVLLTGTDQTGPALSGVVEVSAGSFHSCARLADGTARCWGGNGGGQLGDGTSTNRWNPVTVGAGSPLTGIAQISVGTASSNTNGHTCAVLGDGTARCWGGNGGGQLGNGSTSLMAQSNPLTVGGGTPLTGVVEISAGWEFTCAVLIDTAARCWGWRSNIGRLGDGVLSGTQLTPSHVVASLGGSSLSAVTGISTGYRHACSVVAGGVNCWGGNRSGATAGGYGGLGDGTSTDRSTAVRVLASGTEAASPTPLGGSLVFGPTTLTVTVTDSTSATASATVPLTSGP